MDVHKTQFIQMWRRIAIRAPCSDRLQSFSLGSPDRCDKHDGPKVQLQPQLRYVGINLCVHVYLEAGALAQFGVVHIGEFGEERREGTHDATQDAHGVCVVSEGFDKGDEGLVDEHVVRNVPFPCLPLWPRRQLPVQQKKAAVVKVGLGNQVLDIVPSVSQLTWSEKIKSNVLIMCLVFLFCKMYMYAQRGRLIAI